MTKYIIQGGRRLHGQVTVSSAKNAAVAILAGTVLVEGPCVIENLPKISDITVQLEILRIRKGFQHRIRAGREFHDERAGIGCQHGRRRENGASLQFPGR